MADAALAALRAATCECAAMARRFSPDQSSEAVALSDVLRNSFSRSAAAATPTRRVPPLLPQLPTELIVEVLRHLDVRSLGSLAGTCRLLCFGPPCPPRPTSLVEAALRRRADEGGRWTPSSLPEGVSKWVPFLLQREWRNELEVRTVTTGRNCSFFMDANGALLACGKERVGEVGVLGLQEGSSQTSFTAVAPTAVPSMAGVRIRTVDCHEVCNLALSEAGQVFEWGRQQEPAQCRRQVAAVPTVMEELRDHRMRQVITGISHCAALTEDGALFTRQTRGRVNSRPDEPVPELGHGRRAHGRRAHDSGAPHRVLAFEGLRIASVAVGVWFTVAVVQAGVVYSFGAGDGRLGHGYSDREEYVLLPKRIEALDGIHVTSVAAGAFHALALTRCGRVYSWGIFGRDSSVHGLGDTSDIDDDDFGLIPQLITALLGERVRAIVAGPDTSCAVTDAGALYTWGRGGFGALRHADVRDRNIPKLVTALHGINVVGVSMHFRRTLAVAADGSAYAFGEGPGLGIRLGGEGEQIDETTRSPQRIPDFICMVSGRHRPS
jgi:alpha-tubulin suppressor-like RCC1 family protein